MHNADPNPDDSTLYVVKRTVLDPRNPSGLTSTTTLPATLTSLPAAKAEAKALLPQEGYDTDFFKIYEVKSDPEKWKYGEGVMVYAEAPSGEVFKVGIDTVPNLAGLKAGDQGRVLQPLYHVVQTLVEYGDDRSGTERYAVVEGTYADKGEARERALKVLLDENVGKEDFVEYDEYDEDGERPFGGDVVVHAVKEGGENILVSNASVPAP
ncbi:hypothetical protein PSPO01_15306 [Paraphaeosphaeria sporulosa]